MARHAPVGNAQHDPARSINGELHMQGRTRVMPAACTGDARAAAAVHPDAAGAGKTVQVSQQPGRRVYSRYFKHLLS